MKPVPDSLPADASRGGSRELRRCDVGAAYVDAITASAADRRARETFQRLVLGLAPPGARLYDFGAGPGIDARFYAESGYTVGAYDADPRMRAYFAAQCRDLIDTGRVILDCGSYREFLACRTLNGGRRADLVVANFAPLNLIEDLPELFAKLHSLLVPDGAVLASVLSPCFFGDLRYRWWWTHALSLWRTGHYAIGEAEIPVVRRRLGQFAAQCSPGFTLERIYRGLPGRAGGAPQGHDFQHRGALAWWHMTSCRFMFLLFRRASASAGTA